jgi:hypothetical protein
MYARTYVRVGESIYSPSHAQDVIAAYCIPFCKGKPVEDVRTDPSLSKRVDKGLHKLEKVRPSTDRLNHVRWEGRSLSVVGSGRA